MIFCQKCSEREVLKIGDLCESCYREEHPIHYCAVDSGCHNVVDRAGDYCNVCLTRANEPAGQGGMKHPEPNPGPYSEDNKKGHCPDCGAYLLENEKGVCGLCIAEKVEAEAKQPEPIPYALGDSPQIVNWEQVHSERTVLISILLIEKMAIHKKYLAEIKKLAQAISDLESEIVEELRNAMERRY